MVTGQQQTHSERLSKLEIEEELHSLKDEHTLIGELEFELNLKEIKKEEVFKKIKDLKLKDTGGYSCIFFGNFGENNPQIKAAGFFKQPKFCELIIDYLDREENYNSINKLSVYSI